MITLSIYTVAGPDIGLGHYRRMLVLLSACVAAGINARLYLRGARPAFIRVQQGCEHRIYNIDSAAATADLTVVDGVTIDDIDSRLLTGTLLVQVDDNGSNDCRPDVYINPNLYGDSIRYPASCLVLAGKQYNLIADTFFIEKNESHKKGVVVAFGGSDDGALAINTAIELRKTYKKNIATLIARDELCIEDKLLALAKKQHIDVICNQDSAEYIIGCEIYVGAAGVSCSEAMAAGCEIAVCAIVKDQLKTIDYLKSQGFFAFSAIEINLLLDAVNKLVQQPLKNHSVMTASGAKSIINKLLNIYRRNRS